MQTPHIHGLEANMQEVPAKEGGKFDVQPGLATHYSTPLPLLDQLPGRVLTSLGPTAAPQPESTPHVLLCMPCNYFELNSYFVRIL